MDEKVDDLGRRLFGETLQDATVRILGFMAAVAFVLGTVAWLAA